MRLYAHADASGLEGSADAALHAPRFAAVLGIEDHCQHEELRTIKKIVGLFQERDIACESASCARHAVAIEHIYACARLWVAAQHVRASCSPVPSNAMLRVNCRNSPNSEIDEQVSLPDKRLYRHLCSC